MRSPSRVLKRGADWVTGQLDATKELAPPERLERYFDLFHDLHGKAERMCPGGSFASVLGAVSPAVQRALHAFTKMHLDWLEGVVREGAALGAFEIGEQAPRDVALQIFSSVQGALLTGRLTADQGVLDVVATELRRRYSAIRRREEREGANPLSRTAISREGLPKEKPRPAAPHGVAMLLRVLLLSFQCWGCLQLGVGGDAPVPPSLVDADSDSESTFSLRVKRGKHISRSRPTFSLRSTSHTAASRVS